MRLVFLGTPREAAESLRAVHEAGHEVAFALTRPDRRRGRGGEASPSPVKREALDLGIPVETPARATDLVERLRDSGAELGVVVAFGQILRPEVLEALPHGFVNVHYSLLPRWRGAAPVERAILAGDRVTGVCLMEVEEGLDTGGVYAAREVEIGAEETAGELRERLAGVGAGLLVEHLDAIPGATPEPQRGEPTYADKLSVDEFRLDWRRPASELARTVRAGNPSPGAWTRAGRRRLKVWRARASEASGGAGAPGSLSEAGAEPEPGAGSEPGAGPGAGSEVGPGSEPGVAPGAPIVATGEGALVLEVVQPEGKRAMAAAEWWRGFQGDSLG